MPDTRGANTLATMRGVARRGRNNLRRARMRLGAPLRRAYYTQPEAPVARAVRRLPASIRNRLGADDPTAIGSRRLEIGSGVRPQPGYIHVDVDALAPHVEAFAPAHELPFPNGWASEVVAIHSLEHVLPSMLRATLLEWRRVLEPGGRLRVHVPDSAQLMRAYLAADLESKWSLSGALLGMYSSPAATTPERLLLRADHQVLFDAALLTQVLEDAGYTELEDVSATVRDVHSDGWSSLIPQISLIFVATSPGLPT